MEVIGFIRECHEFPHPCGQAMDNDSMNAWMHDFKHSCIRFPTDGMDLRSFWSEVVLMVMHGASPLLEE